MSTPTLDTSVADRNLRFWLLPLVGRRPLTDAERRHLRQEAHGRWHGPRGCLVLTLAFLLFLAVTSGLGDASEIVVSQLGLVLFGVLAAFWLDGYRRARDARADRANGWSWVFEGPIVAANGDVAPSRAELLTSGRIWRVDFEEGPTGAKVAAVAEAIERQFGPASQRVEQWWRPADDVPQESAATALLWCEGLPLAGERALDAGERAELAGMCRRRIVAVVLLVYLPLLALVASAFAIHQDTGSVLPFFALLGSILAMVLGWSQALHLIQWIPVVLRELRLARVYAFAARRELQPDDWVEESRHVLAGGLLWAVNGYRYRQRTLLKRVEVAAGPSLAAVTAEFLQLREVAPGQHVAPNQRQLQPDELYELSRIVARSRPYPAVLGLMLMLWVVVQELRAVADGVFVGLLALLYLAFPLGLLLWVTPALFALHRAYRNDLAAGVVLLRRPAEWPLPAQERAVPLDAEIVEILPYSGSVWAIDRQPSAWRLRA